MKIVQRKMHFASKYLLLLLAVGIGRIHAQNPAQNLQQALAEKRFHFEAQTVVPTGGGVRQIDSDGYQLRLRNDSLVSDLPYFGRAYSAPLNSDGGIHFNTTQFLYSVKNKRRGGWEVNIKPASNADTRELVLSVSENGYASLRVLSNSRQPISFNGIVKADE